MKKWTPALAYGAMAVCLSMLAGCDAARSSGRAQFHASEVYESRSSLNEGHAGGKRLRRIFFNPYTDSIKTVLNYYVNVEGEYNDGSYLPLDTADIILRCDQGTLAGNEWIIPKKIDFEKVTFTAIARANPQLRDTITLWIQKWKDPRDAPDYKDPEEERYRR